MRNKEEISYERRKYLRKIKFKKISIKIVQILIIVVLIALWEILANAKIIDSFIMSQPSRILKTFFNLWGNGLFEHVKTTCLETIIGFSLGTCLGFIIAMLLWWSKFFSKVLEPFLVVLNSLPKIALRTSNNNLGWSGNASYYSYGTCNIINCNNTRNIKWIFKYR